MKKVLFILQNAWSPMYAGGTWPRDSWLRALHRSRSGQRLRTITKAVDATGAFEFDYDNTTPQVTAKPCGVSPIDYVHVEGVLARLVGYDVERSVVVLCGDQAAKVLDRFLIPQPTLLIPHPAYRVVTNLLLEQAADLIRNGFQGQVRLKQDRGRVVQSCCKSSPERA